MRYSNLWVLVVIIAVMLIGLSTIYSITDIAQPLSAKKIFLKQFNWSLIGLFVILVFSNIHYIRLWDFSYLILALSVILLVFVEISGDIRLGAQRWLSLGSFNFQPSELVKFSIILFLARYFGSKSTFDTNIRKRNIFVSFLFPLMVVCIPTGLIMIQPDLGTAIICFSIVLAMFFVTGVKLRYILSFLGVGLLLSPLGWFFLKDYQKDRLLVFINPDKDPLGAGYTIIQSKIAIGAGSFVGEGFLSSLQSQLKFLPESHTDFIFAAFAEQWGFAGTILLLLLYFLIIRFGFYVAQKNNDPFGKFLAYGISFLLSFQVFVNVAMTAGFAPVVGIPLPLMSYGGSSLLANCMGLGILFNINRNRAVF